MAINATQAIRGGPGAAANADPLAAGPAKSTSAAGLPVKRTEPKELNGPQGLFGKIGEQQEQGMDGVSGGMLKMKPDDLKKAMASPESRDRFLYGAMDFDHFGPWSDSKMEVQPVDRKDVMKTLRDLYINPDNGPGEFDPQQRQALEGNLRTVADMLQAKPATDILKLLDHDTGYGSANALALLNRNTGEIRYVVNSWAP